MIELLLQAERALSVGLVDQAERLYRQAADNDPRNAIAVVGLARVALERADDATAYREALRALDIDPENVAARRLVVRLEEVFAARREALPSIASELPTSPGSDRSTSRSEVPFSGSVPPPASGAGPAPTGPTVQPGSETAAQPPSAAPDSASSAPAPSVPAPSAPAPSAAPTPASSPAPTPSAVPAPATSPTSTPTASNTPATSPLPKPRTSSPSLIDRLLRRKRS